MTASNFTGSCLCGSVRYEVTGEARRFYHCHCGRCRKASGTGHATNLGVEADAIRWLAGEALIGSYKVPESKRFTRVFCTRCGAQLPRVVEDIGLVVIPAGSLDSEFPDLPQARIFWDSRAQWSCGDDGLPVFPGYPPGV